MKIEEAMVYVLASANRGMKTAQIAEIINRKKQVYAVAMSHPDTFVKSDGMIRLLI